MNLSGTVPTLLDLITTLILTLGDMTAMTGTVREVIGKSLKALEEKGVIISNSRRIIIRDSDALIIRAGLA